MTIPMGVLLLIAAVYAVKHKGADAPGIVLGVCIGVMGANGWVGQAVWSLLDAVTKAGEQLTQVKVF